MGACLLLAGSSVLGGPPAHADAAIEIDATAETTPTFWFEDVAFSVVVTNTGTEPVTDVTVEVSAVMEPVDGATTGPVDAGGNGDDVLDVGERWTYAAVAPASFVEFGVSAAGATSTVSAYHVVNFGSYPEGLAQPVDVTFETEPDPPVAGVVRWTITATNRIEPDLGVDGDYQVVFPGGFTGRDPLGEPSDRGNDDDVLSQGESWRWEVEALAEGVGTHLRVDVRYRRPGFENGHQITGLRSQATEPPPSTSTTTTPAAPTTEPTTTAASGVLPETGADARVAALAWVLVAAGALVLVLAGRRSGRTSSHRPG